MKIKKENKVLLKLHVNSTDPTVKHRYAEVGWQLVPTEAIETRQDFYWLFCKSGCKNYGRNGGCPPFAPSFDALRKVYKYMVVVYCRMSTDQFPKSYLNPNKNMAFFAIQFARTQLQPIMKAIYSHPKPFSADRLLGESDCKLCNPCQVPKTGICRHPKERVFSLESTGVNTNKLMEDFVFPLHWFSFKSPVSEVPYSSKLIGFLYKDEPSEDFTKILTDTLNLHPRYEAIPFTELGLNEV